MRKRIALAAWAVATALAGCAGPELAPPMTWSTLDGAAPLVIAHRGASGYLPEHTLEAYKLAIEMGADVIEPDLVFTKDGVLVARHDRYLSTTTDVADRPEFAARKRANDDPEDSPREDWWVEDFTLAELKTLRARQPFPGRPKEHDGLYGIPTFEEVLALVNEEAAKAGRTVGVYPETKHAGFFASIGHDFEAPLLAALDGFDAGPVFIQSFEPEILKRLRGKTEAKLVQLVYVAPVVGETSASAPNIPLEEIATYADGVGLEKNLVTTWLEWDERGIWRSGFVEQAHALGLAVHAWTFRDDQPNLALHMVLENSDAPLSLIIVEDDAPSSVSGDSFVEYSMFFSLGVDGAFTDFPDTAVQIRETISQPAHPGESRDER
ncbi:MAG: glycerophosphodiester phosphodiesterase family protein [Pseudomonadota bacterium]|nr:glycerophosphodiester phosphodiesterase family protein [Pseudomonadota bacterium]